MSSGSRASKKAKSTTKRIGRGRRRKSASRPSSASAKSGSRTLNLNDDWREFLHALISTGTRFLLIGGHAVAVHGEARFTEDLDVFAEPIAENAEKLLAALVEFGFGSLAPSLRELAEPDRVWMLGRKPRRIDILTSISGVTFHSAWQKHIHVALGQMSIPVIGRDALIANKTASGRTKDLLDVELLKKRSHRQPRRR